ncbi:MAG: OmpA family protein [Ferruginibacter sp.]
MSFNLIDAAKGLFTNEIVNRASSTLGESESGISKAMSALIPTVLSGVISKASSSDGANAVAQMANEQHQSGVLDNIGGLLGGGGSGVSSLLSGLFGNKTDMIGSLISNFAGVKSSSSSSLLSLAVPAIMSLIGKHASSSNLNASGLASFLGGQKNAVESALPAGFSLSSLFGGASNMAGEAASSVRHAAQTVSNEVEEKKSGMGWLLPVLLLAALAAAALYFTKGCKGDTTTTPVSDTVKTDSPSVVEKAVTATTAAVSGTLDSLGNYVYNLGNMITLDLPGGAKLEVGENSTEAKLVRFLQGSEAVDTAKGNWFDFTNVRFKTGSAQITDESMAQLTNMVAIAKAFPNAKFKVGGYTDNTGDEAKNVTLSKNRAAAVATKLKQMGAAAASIVSSDGYGSQFPVADNATAEGRAQNRRVSVNVKAK